MAAKPYSPVHNPNTLLLGCCTKEAAGRPLRQGSKQLSGTPREASGESAPIQNRRRVRASHTALIGEEGLRFRQKLGYLVAL
jgi:hypothetical protein